MIRKQEIIDVLLDYGLSPIESSRTTDTIENFRGVIEDILDKEHVEASQEVISGWVIVPNTGNICYVSNRRYLCNGAKASEKALKNNVFVSDRLKCKKCLARSESYIDKEFTMVQRTRRLKK